MWDALLCAAEEIRRFTRLGRPWEVEHIRDVVSLARLDELGREYEGLEHRIDKVGEADESRRRADAPAFAAAGPSPGACAPDCRAGVGGTSRCASSAKAFFFGPSELASPPRSSR